MTSGVPLYLVSACGSAEEFVAAFRRYADRTGLFIPSAAPLPAGRRGRIALTLRDGGVMIEGEAEILQSSAKPTVLHGRPGMTVKFVETDEPSKAMIIELEKARLAMKPAPTSATPRPASLPAEPRPVVPPTGGRIDAANALAECVVIGNVAALEATSGPPKPDGKFVVPSIPTRPKTPSSAGTIPPPTSGTIPPPTTAPPTPTPAVPAATRPTPTSMPNPNSKLTSIGFPIVDKLPAQTESGKVSNATTLGMPALDRLPAEMVPTQVGTPVPPPNKTPVRPIDAQQPPAEAKPVVAARPAPKSPIAPTIHDELTTMGEGPPRKPDADPMPPKPTPAVPSSSKPEEPTSGLFSRRGDSKHKATSIGFPAIRTPFETQAVGVVPPPTKPEPGEVVSRSSKPRSKGPTTPPLTPRHPTPAAPLPIMRPPAGTSTPGMRVDAEDEKTDLVGVPVDPITPPPDSGPVYVSSSLPEEVLVPQVDGFGPTLTTRSGGMRASEIMAAIAPTEDWTMSPDASGPTVMPSMKDVVAKAVAAVSEPTPAPGPPPGPPTGDWTISLDPEAGWSEPAKVVPPPPLAAAAGNPDRVVASDKPFTAVEWEEKPTGIGDPKIEIDPTLMEPHKAMPAAADDEGSPKALPPTPTPGPMRPLAPMPPAPPSNLFGAQTAGSGPGPNLFAAPPIPTFDHLPRNLDPLATYNIHGAQATTGKRKRTIVIAIGAAVALIAGFVLVLVLSSGTKSKPAAGSAAVVKTGSNTELGSAIAGSNVEVAQPGSAAVETGSNVEVGSGSADVAIVAPGSAGSAADTETPTPVASGPCKVTISSLPPGADVLLASAKLGTTPGTFELPCGTESKLTLKKSRFLATARSVKPAAGKPNKILVKLGKQLFQVKVTSTPAGATITAGGKTMGVTPTTIKLPGYEPTSITLTKPGFSKDVQRVTPKNNNASHRVVLKKGK